MIYIIKPNYNINYSGGNGRDNIITKEVYLSNIHENDKINLSPLTNSSYKVLNVEIFSRVEGEMYKITNEFIIEIDNLNITITANKDYDNLIVYITYTKR